MTVAVAPTPVAARKPNDNVIHLLHVNASELEQWRATNPEYSFSIIRIQRARQAFGKGV